MTVAILRAARHQPGFHFGEIIRAAGRRGVAAIGDRVDHDVVHAGFVRRLGERDEMILMAVHAAVGDESEEMQALALRLREGLLKHRIRREFAVDDRLVDAREILINDRAPRRG